MKNSNSCDEMETLLRLKRWPISGRLPSSGTSVVVTFWVETMIPPTTTVPPSGTRIFVSSDCVSNAGTPWMRGMPWSICVFSTNTSMKTVPSAVICGVTSSFSTASMNCTEIVLLIVVWMGIFCPCLIIAFSLFWVTTLGLECSFPTPFDCHLVRLAVHLEDQIVDDRDNRRNVANDELIRTVVGENIST